MTSKTLVILAAILFCFALGILGQSERGACCEKYSKTRVPFKYIAGYREQKAGENCRIDAIIFLTINQRQTCANKNDKWVQEILRRLSARLKEMSKPKSGKGEEAPVTKSGRRSVHDGSGYFFSSNNDTDIFY